MFEIGDIITGAPNNTYSYTTEAALMAVINYGNTESTINVLVLAHNEDQSPIGNVYPVDNTGYKFKHITFEEFEEKYPSAYTMDDDTLDMYIQNYDLKIKRKEPENPYILSDEMREELIDEMETLLKEYHYHPTRDALNKILDTWCINKADLIRMFEKHPNYNGKFQIVFDHDFDRVLDKKGINNFRDWILSNEVKNLFVKEIQLGAFTYKESNRICNRLNNIIGYFEEDYDGLIKTINGKTEEEYRKEYRHFNNYRNQYERNSEITIDRFSLKTYEKKEYNAYSRRVSKLDSILSYSNLGQFIDEALEDYIDDNFPEAKVKEGQKTSRAINKILTLLGINKLPNYNKEFAKFADAVNPLKIKRHTIISVHPVDYLTMSFGNSWASCHTIDKNNDRHIDGEHNYQGCNSSGTESYMLDSTSCIFYTVRSEYNGNKLELEDKINRCMFHYHDNRLLQGRVYPQSNDNGANDLYKDIREIAQKVFADILDVPNYWTNKSGCNSCSNITNSRGTHYRDYLHYDNCNVSTLKDERDKHELIKIGHNPICPCCGKIHDFEDAIECRDCYC